MFPETRPSTIPQEDELAQTTSHEDSTKSNSPYQPRETPIDIVPIGLLVDQQKSIFTIIQHVLQHPKSYINQINTTISEPSGTPKPNYFFTNLNIMNVS